MPARVEIKGDVLHVKMLPENESQSRSDRNWPTLTGRIENGQLRGEGKDRRESSFSWIGVRAPDRLDGSDEVFISVNGQLLDQSVQINWTLF